MDSNPQIRSSTGALCIIAVANWTAGSVGSARSIVQQYKPQRITMDGPTEPGDRGDSSVVDRLKCKVDEQAREMERLRRRIEALERRHDDEPAADPLSPRAEAQHGGRRRCQRSHARHGLRLGTRSEGQQLSLVDRAAKVAFEMLATDEERTRLPKYDDESHLSLLSRLEQARRPLEFDRFVSVGRRHSPGGRSGILCRSKGKYRTAASTCIMRAGRHYAAFALVSVVGPTARVGVMRPIRARHLESFDPVGPEACDLIRSERSSRWSGNVHACQYECLAGTCVWNDGERKLSDNGWVGIAGLGGACEVGLLLDLDKGTITVYNDNRRCGIMKNGLAGEYCFCVTQCSRLGLKGDMVIIRRGNPNTKKRANE
ncbi:hypothetical protein THAOC_29007 [Thalassiosira oceanica]|uniref:B30.2/SPRY domain-containing protein n=1 Tax=Thalassiosira oceanica TaxID=159749 RepID=K0RS97_THAOC|nr:hypothetical protein THAOC_29007 [Thalassiosira oceanica]|eukprot:EJK51791.1 hypothetical protein THAOC_29007 [Thalassiosira oceanica]